MQFFYFKGDDIVLLDYKTDKLDEEKLKAYYTKQLELYAEALVGITGKTVSEKLIYSFKLGKIINV